MGATRVLHGLEFTVFYSTFGICIEADGCYTGATRAARSRNSSRFMRAAQSRKKMFVEATLGKLPGAEFAV